MPHSDSPHREQYLGKTFSMTKNGKKTTYTYDGVDYDFINGVHQRVVLITPKDGQQIVMAETYFWSRVSKNDLLLTHIKPKSNDKL